MKTAIFLGDSRERLRGFPEMARRRAGYQLDRVQHGFDPDDWKPMGTIGAGVREIRIRADAGAFRVVYVATRPEAVYVLHCFEKKSQRTGRLDIALATKRYNDLARGER
jgi:phage-related protein